ncbi:ADP-ribosylglycohydrolase family protein [Allorhizobium taibaishanense]|uniref:ADP-ribosylglycohydrolase n=2 Tax=Allorhizobium taibaishanense TaxID=887144 RepID=A0A7W6HQE1_9HYPH|nr:ADP-ribosylglycohydrolase family protein [Allorhizobium taibaishanense]MBB4009509.1 ADP-ribosylglycohydrolase [Allorhizobium taibaishanense]
MMDMEARAIGCLLGQLAGDALGSLVEFRSPEEIRGRYPLGVREMHDGGTWDTIAGQPTDDSEMALGLARSIIAGKGFQQAAARKAYGDWLASQPFDVGMTVLGGIQGKPNGESQANGALMRIAPLGIFGARHSITLVGTWAEEDAVITHPNPICRQINNLFARAVAHAVAVGPSPSDLYDLVARWAEELNVDPIVHRAILDAKTVPAWDFMHQQGWVIIAFQNALFQILHAASLEDGVADTVSRGGDTDTNAAIAGALLGAVHGESAIPGQWRQTLLNCRPQAGLPRVKRPRPQVYWPIDAVELARGLLNIPAER